MKILLGAVIGALLAWGVFAACELQKSLHPDPLAVVASSVSPDSKWICEIVDITSKNMFHQILIHGQAYKGRSNLERGFCGECVVMDLDSEGVSPNTKFTWSGSDVTIEGYPIRLPVRLRCTSEGAVVLRE